MNDTIFTFDIMMMMMMMIEKYNNKTWFDMTFFIFIIFVLFLSKTKMDQSCIRYKRFVVLCVYIWGKKIWFHFHICVWFIIFFNIFFLFLATKYQITNFDICSWNSWNDLRINEKCCPFFFCYNFRLNTLTHTNQCRSLFFLNNVWKTATNKCAKKPKKCAWLAWFFLDTW